MSQRLSRLRRDGFWLVPLLSVAAVLQLVNITKWSIWHDEAFTIMLIDYDWSEILRRTALDVHPPLYYLVLKAWTSVFGSSLLAARSLSVLATLLLMLVMYFLVKRLFDVWAARLSLFFMVIGPFIIRYAQEARMYAIAALLVAAATYLLVVALDKNNKWYLYGYALVMALAIYTHYYTLFMVPVYWLYILSRTKFRARPRAKTINLFNIHWWGANSLILVLLAPWLPKAIKQFTSIQGAFWIPPVDYTTGFDTLVNFLTYQFQWQIKGLMLAWLLSLVAGLLVVLWLALVKNKPERPRLWLLVAYSFLPPIIIFALSLPPWQPIYNNRYFSLTAVAFYALLGILIVAKPINRWRLVQVLAFGLITATLIYGVYNVQRIGNYNPDRNEYYTMKDLAQAINDNYQAGDAIVSTNLSTYFDIRYYNRTSAQVRLHVERVPDGIGNTSLVYDRSDILLLDYNQLKPKTGRIWLVTDSHDAQPQVPANWQRQQRTQAGYAAIQEYLIVGQSEVDEAKKADGMVCAQVITTARNRQTGEIREFPNACLPEGWEALPR
ncbi:glycosyltransferase family 39 protein [Candidatus Microgenomates bacterium]|nr:glycosyltransferase family 39 protein [Candidatus Microgenomates bacterium]